MRKQALYVSVLFLLSGCNGVSYVERVVLVNPTDYNLLVYVKGADDTSWLSLGIANRNAETENQEVIDMGETWVFRFSYVGEELGEDRIARSDLVRNRWRYEIPQRVGEMLKEKGYAPSIG